MREFMSRVSPGLQSPSHLAPLPAVLDGFPHSGRRVIVSMPVQHGKTTVACHAIAWWLTREPGLSIVYASNAYAFAQRQSRVIRGLALQAGVELSAEHNTIGEWRTVQGGGLLATSVDGQLTGHRADVLVVDDPYKNREEAESAEYRDKLTDWRRSVAMTRLPPDGAVMIIASRWPNPRHRSSRCGYLN